MKKIFSLMVLLLGSMHFISADNYFDDKVLDSPVPHKRSYNQEEFTLKKVVRNVNGVVLTFEYYNPWRAAGWAKRFPPATALKDPMTGKTYPLIYAEGIPKEPYEYVFPQDGEQRLTATLVYAPVPSDVKTVNTDFGFYDIDISGLPEENNGRMIRRWFPADLKAETTNLRIEAISDDGENIYLWFKYTTPDGYGSNKPCLDKNTHILDPKTGKKYLPTWSAGLPVAPEYLSMFGNTPVGFAISFQSPSKDGVKTFDFIETPTSSWNIKGISLD